MKLWQTNRAGAVRQQEGCLESSCLSTNVNWQFFKMCLSISVTNIKGHQVDFICNQLPLCPGTLVNEQNNMVFPKNVFMMTKNSKAEINCVIQSVTSSRPFCHPLTLNIELSIHITQSCNATELEFILHHRSETEPTKLLLMNKNIKC